MTREQMVYRAGCYAGIASRRLGDDSYAERWCGRGGEMTEIDYVRESAEIQQRLVAAGLIGPDEDPAETFR